MKIKEEPLESHDPSQTSNVVVSEDLPSTSTMDDEQTVSAELSSIHVGSCEIDDPPTVPTAKRDEDILKDGSDAENEIDVSVELQSSVVQEKVSVEMEEKFLPDTKTPEMISAGGEKVTESKTESPAKDDGVSEVVEMAEVDLEDTDSVKTKEDTDAKAGMSSSMF